MRSCSGCYSGGKGIYAKLMPSARSLQALKYLERSAGTSFPLMPSPHITLVCSKSVPDSIKFLPRAPMRVILKEALYWEEGNKGLAVITVDSKSCHHLHYMFRRAGALHAHDVYTPHITFGIDLPHNKREIEHWVYRTNHLLKHMSNRMLVFDRVIIRDLEF